jgi:hypothetical protein
MCALLSAFIHEYRVSEKGSGVAAGRSTNAAVNSRRNTQRTGVESGELGTRLWLHLSLVRGLAGGARPAETFYENL